jgi:DNA-binding beta-propeller fold protein YncE
VTDPEQAAVFILDPDRRLFGAIGAGERRAAFRVPIGLAVDDTDTIYVGDNGHRQVLVFGPDLTYRMAIGGRDVLEAPSGLAADTRRQRLFVVDTRRHALLAFDLKTGRLVGRIGGRGGNPGQFSYPTGVAVGPDGLVYVTDTLNYRVQVFDGDLRFVRSFGTLGINPGQFRRPKGIAIDAKNIVYVVDSDFNNFQMLTADGQPLMAVGEYGTRPGQMILPAGIWIHRPTHRIYVCEQANRRIQIFARIVPSPPVPPMF